MGCIYSWPTNYAVGVAAKFIQGLVIGYLYPYYDNGQGSPVLRGVKFNLVIGLMTYTAMGFATAAKFQIEPAMHFIGFHTVFQAIQFTATGAALGYIYDRQELT